MNDPDSKRTLWENVSSLMKHAYAGENLTRLAKEAKISPGSATRLKEQQTSVGIDLVARVARVFKLEPWQLLVPDLDASRPPSIQQEPDPWPFPQIDRQRWTRLEEWQQNEIQGVVRDKIENFERDSPTKQSTMHGLQERDLSRRGATAAQRGKGKDAA